MILLLAVAAGLLAGLGRAWYGGHHLQPPNLRMIWLVPIAFLPRWLAFYLPATRKLVGDNNAAAAALVGSQALLLIFAWLNRNQPGFWPLGLGLALNLLVIALNGGLMPISPEVAAQLLPGAPPDTLQVGERVGWNIVVSVTNTRLWWLSDHLVTPTGFPYQKALSIGDMLVAGGAFWLLWTCGAGETNNPLEKRSS
jgi:hypothetical protein